MQISGPIAQLGNDKLWALPYMLDLAGVGERAAKGNCLAFEMHFMGDYFHDV